jgi:hypothetical protein
LRSLPIVLALLLAREVGVSQTITNTLKNFSRNGTTYTFEMWSQASQSGMSPNQALFQVHITSGAFTITGSTATLESKFSSLGPVLRAIGSPGDGTQFFQWWYGGSSLTGIEITTAAGGEKVLTFTCKIIDTTKTAGLTWFTANGWYWMTNLWAGSDDSPLPVQLSSFTVNTINRATCLIWITTSEISNYGFYVQCGSSIDNLADVEDGFVAGHGTTLQPHEYSWIDQSPAAYYRLRQVDMDGTSHLSDVITFTLTDIEENTISPVTLALDQNYPNPFNPTTMIRYGLPVRTQVTLTIFNTLGQQVAMLVNGDMEAGYHEVLFDGSKLASGVYLYRMQAGSYVETRKLLLVR